MEAIIYTSNAGTTEKYAKLLGEKTGLPVYRMKEAKGVEAGSEILYLGWLMASEVKGYKRAKKKWKISAVCAVGMGETGTQMKEVRDRNHIEDAIPVFTLRGGLDLNKLHGIYKMMMTIISKAAGKGLGEKTDRTPDEDIMYEMMMHGGDYVSIENLGSVLEWMKL